MNILRVKELLAEKEATGKDLAKQVGISEMAMSNIVSGKSFPRAEVLLKIAEVLKVDIRELFHPTSSTSIEPIYIKKDGKFISVGEIDIKKIDQKV